MTKTTIDGLKVRSSSKKTAPMRRAGKSIGQSTARTTKTTKATKATRAKKPVASESFLDPVSSFATEEEFSLSTTPVSPVESTTTSRKVTKANSSWEDLLMQMQEESDEIRAAENTNEDFLNGVNSLEDDWESEWQKGLRPENAIERELEEDTKRDSRKNSRRAEKKARKIKKRHLGRKILIAVILLIVVAAGVVYFWGDSLIAKLTGGRSGFWSTLSAMITDAVPFQTDADGRTNILVFGTEGYDMSGSVGDGVHAGAQLTDSIMVISLDQNTKDVALISLPRDLKVSGACMAGKVNEVFACANPEGTDEQAGAEAMMKEIGEILGIDFQYYAHVNWGSLVNIVDTLGGVTVTLDEDINDYEFTGAVVPAGVPTTLNGEQALGVARARYGTQGGDFSRGNSQQKIVMAIMQKLLDNGAGITEAVSLLNILGDNLRTNFSAENIKAGLQLLRGLDIATIRQIPLVDYENEVYYMTTAMIDGISYVVPAAGAGNYLELQKYIDDQLKNDQTEQNEPDEVAQIAIFNSDAPYGTAEAEQVRMGNDGFNIITIRDIDEGQCMEKYCLYRLTEKPATEQKLVEYLGVNARDGSELSEDLWFPGADFVILLGV